LRQNSILMFYRNLLLGICFIFCSCQSALDRPFIADRYEQDLMQLGIEELVSAQEMFLINHVIVRERDYLDYQLKGKNFGDILAMAKDMSANGMTIKSSFPEVELSKDLQVKITNEGTGYHEQKKVLKFAAEFQNSGVKDLALQDASFLVYGPFQDHITTAAYQINTKIKAGKSQKLFFLVDAKNMRENMLFGRAFSVRKLFMDDIIIEADIQLGGLTVTKKNVNNYDKLKIKDQYMMADKEFSYPRELKGTEWYEKDANGKATLLKPGLRHYPQ